MDPGTLVSNIGHGEEVTIQASLSNGFLEKRFMSARRTRSNDHAVNIILENDFLDFALGVLRTGVEVLASIYDVGQSSGVLNGGGDVDYAADIFTAVTDEDADAWWLACYVNLGRVLLGFGESAANI